MAGRVVVLQVGRNNIMEVLGSLAKVIMVEMVIKQWTSTMLQEVEVVEQVESEEMELTECRVMVDQELI
jgi:hypothetical protein